LVRDLRDHRVPASQEDLADLETDVLAGFVLARASAGLADSTIRNDTNHLELIRDWSGRPLREMQPDDADAYFGKVLRDAKPSTRIGRACLRPAAAWRTLPAFRTRRRTGRPTAPALQIGQSVQPRPTLAGWQHIDNRQGR
jgi:hypothetical protein